MPYNIAETDKAYTYMYDKCHHILNPLSRMKLPTFIKLTSPFSSSWLLGIVLNLIQILVDHPVSKQWRS